MATKADIASLETRLAERIDTVETRLTERIDGVEMWVVEHFESLYKQLWLVALGIVTAIAVIVKLL